MSLSLRTRITREDISLRAEKTWTADSLWSMMMTGSMRSPRSCISVGWANQVRALSIPSGSVGKLANTGIYEWLAARILALVSVRF